MICSVCLSIFLRTAFANLLVNFMSNDKLLSPYKEYVCMCNCIGQTFIHLQTFETEQRDKDTFNQRLNPDYCKSTMYVFIRVAACLTVTVMLVYLARGVFVKTKACVEFQLINYSVNVPLLGQRHGITRQECMTSCIRSNVSCGAINFRSINGACEFLPYQTCMSLQETVETGGTNVVQLGRCDGVSPGIGLLTPPEHRLRWLTLSEKGSRDVIDLGSGRSVARVIYKGMYLPGFTNKKGIFKAVDMKRNSITCSNEVQYLTIAAPTDYSWVKFTTNNSVPADAVIGGYWWDGAPLYVLGASTGGFRALKSGFYNPATQKAYVQQAGGQNAPEPQNLEILLEN